VTYTQVHAIGHAARSHAARWSSRLGESRLPDLSQPAMWTLRGGRFILWVTQSMHAQSRHMRFTASRVLIWISSSHAVPQPHSTAIRCLPASIFALGSRKSVPWSAQHSWGVGFSAGGQTHGYAISPAVGAGRSHSPGAAQELASFRMRVISHQPRRHRPKYVARRYRPASPVIQQIFSTRWPTLSGRCPRGMVRSCST